VRGCGRGVRTIKHNATQTLAIVGAGAGLGLAIAKLFGRNGFRVALIARNKAKLDILTAQLAALGIEAAGFAADLLDRPSLVEAFAQVTERYGAIDVLEIAGALDATVENLQPQIDFINVA
jgi:NADP-dependent 3-hydroxy acid dehydrogenase YdfG